MTHAAYHNGPHQEGQPLMLMDEEVRPSAAEAGGRVGKDDGVPPDGAHIEVVEEPRARVSRKRASLVAK